MKSSEMAVQKSRREQVEELFYRNLNLVDRLEAYALGHDSIVPALPSAEPNVTAFLGGPTGAAVVSRWLRVFKQSIRLMREFREVELRTMSEANDEDWEKASDASFRAINALISRARELAPTAD